jgi:hypothetical protein
MKGNKLAFMSSKQLRLGMDESSLSVEGNTDPHSDHASGLINYCMATLYKKIRTEGRFIKYGDTRKQFLCSIP